MECGDTIQDCFLTAMQHMALFELNVDRVKVNSSSVSFFERLIIGVDSSIPPLSH